MSKLVVFATSIFLSAASVFAIAQQAPPKLTPEEVQAARASEKRIMDSIAESNAHPGPTYNAQQCRADAQRWTSDGTDKQFAINGGTSIMVNGQFRVTVNGLTPHLRMPALMERIHEMAVCQTTDEDFQKQYNTYAVLEKVYTEERMFRYVYFLTTHNLMDQFMKEDAEQNK